MKNQVLTFLQRPSVFLFLLACLFFCDLLFGGRIFLARDAMADFLPMRIFEAKALAAGEMPFWNHYWGCGKPFIADTTSQALYPVNLLFLIFQPATAFNLYWLFHVYLAGLGACFLFRQFNFSKCAASLMAVSFMFGTSLIAQLEFPYNGVAMCWIPWIFGVLVRFHNGMAADSRNPFSELWKQRRLVGVLALLFAVQFLANFPEMIIYPMFGYGLYIIIAGIMTRNLRVAIALGLFVGIGGFIGLLITLPQTVPMWELVQYSERAGSFDTRFNMASVSPAHFLTAVFPFLGGFPGFPDKFWEQGLFEFWVGTFYLGAMTAIAAPCALACLGRKHSVLSSARRPWIILGCVLVMAGIILALGENTPIYPWLHAHMPLMNRFRFPAKFLILAIMGLLMLGAAGIDALISLRSAAVQNNDKNNKKPTPAAQPAPANIGKIILIAQAIIVSACGIFAIAVWMAPELPLRIVGVPNPNASKDAMEKAAACGMITWGFLLLSYLWVIALLKTRISTRSLAIAGVALVFCNMLYVSRQIHPTGSSSVMFAKTPEIAKIAASKDYRAFSIYSGVQQYLYADPRPELYNWAGQAGSGGMWLPYEISQFYQAATKFLKYKNLEGFIYSKNQQLSESALDMCGVRWIVHGSQWPDILWGNASREIRITERSNAIPRFKIFNSWAPVENDEAVLNALLQGRYSPARLLVEPTALYGGKSTTANIANADPIFAAGRVAVDKMSVNGVSLKTSTEGKTLLFFGDTWYPGWRAKIDGAEVPINRVNYMFMGVELPPGEHSVDFSYRPTFFTACCLIAMLGLVLAAWAILHETKSQWKMKH